MGRAPFLPDLSGRVAVITGANSGVGLHTARELAVHGCAVTLACRDLRAAAAAAEQFPSNAAVDVVELDLASMSSVREFAEHWKGPLDLLVNNAGVMAPPRRERTADGYERQFGTNHLGHFVLTGMLLPALSESGAGRVVTVSSIAHFRGTEALVDANAGPGYDPRDSYGNSKLANLLFALELQRRLRSHGLAVTSTAAHPGLSATGLASDREGMGANPVLRRVVPAVLRVVAQPAPTAARAPLYAATVAEPGSYTGPQHLGETRGPIGPAKKSRQAGNEWLARRLWQVSEELTGFHYDWSAAP